MSIYELVRPTVIAFTIPANRVPTGITLQHIVVSQVANWKCVQADPKSETKIKRSKGCKK